MLPGFILISILLGLAYRMLIRFLLLRWEALPVWEIPVDFEPSTRLSVLIPARNEAHQIAACLESLFLQQYPEHLVEILVIDDHSVDGTAEVVRDVSNTRLRLLSLPEGLAGKKAALTYGVNEAKGELIMTTDADCRAPQQWLSYMVSCYEAKGPAFITAPVVFTFEDTLLEKFQALDLLGTMLITGAGIQSQTIWMSNGANLAYPRRVFGSVGGFSGIDHLASGDDMLLMHKIAQLDPNSIAFLKNREAAVRTPAVSGWRAFFQQRLRWATKSGTYQDRRIILVLALVFFLCWAILLSPFLALFWGWKGVIPFLILLFFKMWADHRLLSRATTFFRQEGLMRFFWQAQVLHILYIAVIGLAANLFRRYEWKGRRLQ